MDSPRTRSVDRALPGYGIRKESRKNPNGFQGSRNPGRDGKGRESGFNDGKVHKDDLDTYRAKHFPDENRYRVNQAYHKVWVLNGRKGTPSPEDVKAMMKALSRGA